MAEFLEQVGFFVEGIIRVLGYPGITLLLFMENFFPPTPSEVVMPFAGFLVARGEFTFVGVWIAAVLGATLGSLALYYLGIWADERLVRTLLRRYGRYLTLSEADLDQALRLFKRYGSPIVFGGRLLPIPLMRALISVVAGMNRIPPLRFALLTAGGSAIWNGVGLYAGVVLGENWDSLLGFVEQNETTSLLLMVLAVGVVVSVWAVRYRRRMLDERQRERQNSL